MKTNWIDDLNQAVEKHGQSDVARRMGCSDATVHQLRTGNYKASPERIAQWRERFLAAFGPGDVLCPILEMISREQCAAHRKRPFAATSPQRIALFRACKTCINNPDRT